MRPPPPSPERDRRLAALPHHGPRPAVPIRRFIDDLLRSPEYRRQKRLPAVQEILRERLGAHAGRVRPLSLRGGTLTLEVDDGPLLAELRQLHERSLLAAFAATGTAISRLAWRAGRTRMG